MAFQVGSVPHVIGGSYQGFGTIIDNELAINQYPQFATSNTATKNALIPRPGYRPYVGLPQAPVRGIFWQDGRGFAVSGNLFCEFFASQTFVVRGVVEVDSDPCTIVSNGTNDGHQIFLVSGGHGYIFDLNTAAFTDVTSGDLFPAPALGCAFLEGYFLAWKRDSPLFAGSALFDGTDWLLADGAFQAQMQLTVDNIANAISIGGQVYFMGTKNTQIWTNIGAANIPLQPMPNAVPRWGLDAPFSIAGLDNTVFGVGVNEDGARHVIKANGYNFDVISTPAISRMLASVDSLQGALGFAHAWEGHPFYHLSVPGLVTDHGTTTLVYDDATKLWHERSLWDVKLMQHQLELGRCHAYGFNRHLMGDRQSGTIYELVAGQFQDRAVLA